MKIYIYYIYFINIYSFIFHEWPFQKMGKRREFSFYHFSPSMDQETYPGSLAYALIYALTYGQSPVPPTKL